VTRRALLAGFGRRKKRWTKCDWFGRESDSFSFPFILFHFSYFSPPSSLLSYFSPLSFLLLLSYFYYRLRKIEK
jgi:hypothetical protein